MVYSFNDLYHFILNVFLVLNLGFERGWSYNAPIWSVSVEILLYAIFFLVSLTGIIRYRVLLVFVLGGLFLSLYCDHLGRGIFSFFIGGTVFKYYENIVRLGTISKWAKPLIAMTSIGWVTVVIETKYSQIWPMFQVLLNNSYLYENHYYARAIVNKIPDLLSRQIENVVKANRKCQVFDKLKMSVN